MKALFAAVEGVLSVAVGVGGAVDLEQVRRLLVQGRCVEASTMVDRLVDSTEGADHADALAQRLAVLLNLRRSESYSSTMDAAFEAARAHPDPARFGLLHAFASLVALHDRSLERCVWHLVLSARQLNKVELTDANIVRAWHNLAISYSYAGFHGYALGAIEKARSIATSLGMPTERFAAPSIRLRHAISLDQRGDTEGCVRILRDIVQDLDMRRREGHLEMLRPISQRAYGYTIARLGALGNPGPMRETDPRPLLSARTTPSAHTTWPPSARSAWPSPSTARSRRWPASRPPRCPTRHSASPRSTGCARCPIWPRRTWPPRTPPTGRRSS